MAEQTPTPQPSKGKGLAKILVGIMVALTTFGLTLGGLWLFMPQDDTPAANDGKAGKGGKVLACVLNRDDLSKEPNCPPKKAPYIDGYMLKAKSGSFQVRLLRPKDGESKVAIKIRKPDLPHIDVLHAQSHAATGQPVRLYTREYKGEKIVIYLVDTPLEDLGSVPSVTGIMPK